MEMTKETKKAYRKEANHVGWGLIIYNIFIAIIVMIPFFVSGIYLLIQYPGCTEEDEIYIRTMERCMSTGLFYLIAVTLGTLFLFIFFRKRITVAEITQKGKEMDKTAFCKLLCIFMSGQTLFSLFADLLEKGLNLMGYSAIEEIEAASAISTTLSMLLYASFIGPVVEELIYRGIVLRIFQHYGKTVAIFLSALLFGLMHENIPQGAFAFGLGIVLGYVALEYSVYWAILLHIVNNFIFGDVLGWLLAVSGLNAQMQELVYQAVVFLFVIPSVVILWRERRNVREYIKENKADKKAYAVVFSSVSILLFLAIELFVAITGLQKI